MASRRPDLSQYSTGFTVLRIFQAVLNIITIVVTSFTINAVVIPGNCLLILTVRKKRSGPIANRNHLLTFGYRALYHFWSQHGWPLLTCSPTASSITWPLWSLTPVSLYSGLYHLPCLRHRQRFYGPMAPITVKTTSAPTVSRTWRVFTDTSLLLASVLVGWHCKFKGYLGMCPPCWLFVVFSHVFALFSTASSAVDNTDIIRSARIASQNQFLWATGIPRARPSISL